jgi:DNA-binding response OmpR family regulator
VAVWLRLKLVKRLLEQHGFVVETSANGKEAYDQLVAGFEAGAPPHIAILDMQARAMEQCVRLRAAGVGVLTDLARTRLLLPDAALDWSRHDGRTQ